MKINTTNTTNKNKKRVAITTIICAMVVFAMVVVGCGIKKNSTVAEAEADVIATVGTTIDTTETVEETTETIVEETTEIVEETTETVEEEPSEEPSVETPSENTTTETEKPSTTPSENKPSETPSTPSTTETTTETPSVPTTTETPSVPSEPTTTETPSEPTPNVEKCMCGTPMQMMSGYILHRAEGYFALYVHFSNGHSVPYEDKGDGGAWISDYMRANGVASYTITDTWVETTPEWREENVTRMCCPSCRATSDGFIAY